MIGHNYVNHFSLHVHCVLCGVDPKRFLEKLTAPSVGPRGGPGAALPALMCVLIMLPNSSFFGPFLAALPIIFPWRANLDILINLDLPDEWSTCTEYFGKS